MKNDYQCGNPPILIERERILRRILGSSFVLIMCYNVHVITFIDINNRTSHSTGKSVHFDDIVQQNCDYIEWDIYKPTVTRRMLPLQWFEKEIENLTATEQMISKYIGMEYGIKKCGIMIFKRVKITKSHAMKLESGEVIKEVGEEGYKCLG
ncbi:Hypothetical predicted protein [Octopus vulgaris]|uniref:Uncharacterized protein n=1 Tax=Octopus vulgaris TaxID=6645 RepID=A0AA36FDC2_OCTVU|nr:Hypothetical predicted protein [Octopus vulgaris]